MKNTVIKHLRVRSNLRAGEGGGYVNGVWYADKSGVCGGTTPPPSPSPQPPPSGSTGGGYVNGVWYADKSGAC